MFFSHINWSSREAPGRFALICFLRNNTNSVYRFENTYPGVRCDIPAHAYQSGFSPNTQWTEEFAQGAEIRNYWQSVARKYNVYQYVRPQQQVKRTEWLADEGKWKVTIAHLDGSNKVSPNFSNSRMSLTRCPDLRRKAGCHHQRHRPFQCMEAA